MLTAASIMVTRDERFRLVDGYNLEIADVEPQDAGDYVCQISDKVNKDQVHTVEILGKRRTSDWKCSCSLLSLVSCSASQHKGRTNEWPDDSAKGRFRHAGMQSIWQSCAVDSLDQKGNFRRCRLMVLLVYRLSCLTVN